MARVIWSGSFYHRQRGKQAPNWRDRNSGLIVKDKPTIIRRGSRNKAILTPSNKVIGQEITKQHFSQSDPRSKERARVIFAKRRRSDSERKAMMAKLKGKR